MKKEVELKGQELEEEIRKLDAMGLFASKTLEMADEESPVKVNGKTRSASDVSAAAGASPEDVEMADAANERTDPAVIHLNFAGKEDTVPIPNTMNKKKGTPASQATSSTSSSRGHATRNSTSEKPTEPLSPPISTEGSAPQQMSTNASATDVFAHGGVPWYLKPFDPVGTTVHEERYTGREVLRLMSEELSDMDEDTLTELAVCGVGETPNGKEGAALGEMGATPSRQRVTKKAKKKNMNWSRPRRRR